MVETGERRRRTAPRPYLIPAVYLLFILLTLMVVAPIITSGGPMSGTGNIFRQVSYMALFLLSCWAVGATRHRAKLMTLPLTLVLTIGWCWLSLTWAIDPAVSARRILLTSIIIWTIFLIIDDCGYDRTIKTIMIFLAGLLVANYVAIAVWPSAIHGTDSMDVGLIGDWRGLLPQKNFTGAICAFTVLVFAFGGQRIWLALRLGVIVLAAYYLFRTHSKTSLGMLATALAAGAIALRFHPKYRALVIPILTVVSIILMMVSITWWDEMLGPFSRKDALTGRVQIWPHLIAYAKDHPFTGSGYGSFWNIGEESPVYQYTKSWVSQLGNGHNGYLDLLIQIGVPGLILAVVAAILLPSSKLIMTTTASRPQVAFLIATLVFCAGHNMTETSLFERDTIVEVFLMIAVALTAVVTRSPSGPRRSSPSERRPSATLAPRPKSSARV